MHELPFAVPLGTSVKFTVAGAAATVNDSAKTALRLTVATLELSACARDAGEIAATSANPLTSMAFRRVFMKPPLDLTA